MSLSVSLPNNWEPRAYQEACWKYLHAGGKHAELIWHRRSGKDDLALHYTACAAFERTGNYWHMLPQANQARKAVWQAINPHTGKRRIDEAFPKEIRAATIDDEMIIRFINGSIWQVVGSDNYDSLVGSPPIGLTFSEWALCNPSAWAYLRPILAENKGWVIFNTTPRGKNHAYRTFEAARHEAGFFAQRLSAFQTDVFTEEQLEAEKRQLIAEYGEEYGLSIFDQEYGCSFEAANLGAILGRFLVVAEQQGRVSDASQFDEAGSAVHISSDIGRTDSAAWWFWQPRLDGFGVIDFDVDSGLWAEEWIDRLKKRLTANGYKLGTIFLPHDAKNKTFTAKHSPLEQFLKSFGAEHVKIVPETRINHRINAARRMTTKCWFDRTKTQKGLDALSAWHFKYDEETKTFSKEPEHDWASHPGDAFSYGAQMLETVTLEEKPAKGKNMNEVTLDELWDWDEQLRQREVRI